jgi:hypothetical protein
LYYKFKFLRYFSLHQYNPDKKGKSQRTKENATTLIDIHYCPENDTYSVETKGIRMQLDDGVTNRKMHNYQKKMHFDNEILLKTMVIQFVQKKLFTVYPYFFDLINLYCELLKEKNFISFFYKLLPHF